MPHWPFSQWLVACAEKKANFFTLSWVTFRSCLLTGLFEPLLCSTHPEWKQKAQQHHSNLLLCYSLTKSGNTEPEKHYTQIKLKIQKGFHVDNMLPVYFFFVLTGAYFVLPSPHFNVTTPGLDFHLFKSLIIASGGKELVSSQHYSHSLILKHSVDPLE